MQTIFARYTHAHYLIESSELCHLYKCESRSFEETHTVNGESYAGEKFPEFCEFSHHYIQYFSASTFLNSTGINNALLGSQNFSTGMPSRELFTKLFPCVTFPAYGIDFLIAHRVLFPSTIITSSKTDS